MFIVKKNKKRKLPAAKKLLQKENVTDPRSVVCHRVK